MSDNPDPDPDPVPVEPVAEAVAEAPPAPDIPLVDTISAVIEQWVLDYIHNSPVARDTAGFNHLTTEALPELRRRLLNGG